MNISTNVNGKPVLVCVSENNGGHEPMTMIMSFYDLSDDEKKTASVKAITKAKSYVDYNE